MTCCSSIHFYIPSTHTNVDNWKKISIHIICMKLSLIKDMNVRMGLLEDYKVVIINVYQGVGNKGGG